MKTSIDDKKLLTKLIESSLGFIESSLGEQSKDQ